jgi:hypothetical protein
VKAELVPFNGPIVVRKTDTKQPLAIVCVSGGASRASAWTGAVLTRLGQEIPDFSRRVALITGASGGMVVSVR